jgi:hypothetical protein
MIIKLRDVLAIRISGEWCAMAIGNVTTWLKGGK